MLDYGFAGYRRTTVVQKGDRLGLTVPVRLGMADGVEAAAGSGLSLLLKLGQERELTLEVELPPQVDAPVKEGDALGVVRVVLGGQVIARLPAVAAHSVGMPGLLEGLLTIARNWEP